MCIGKIRHRIEKFCCSPIEVFVFHAVSDCFDERENKRVDWLQTADFERRILSLKGRFRFISLDMAYCKLRRQWFRRRRYAVLTCDDGYASVLGVLPFLEKECVPVTLFVNPKYLDGVSKRDGYAETPHYISREQLWKLDSGLVTVGMHGYGHDDVTRQSAKEFEESVDKCVEVLQTHPGYIPYFAYTWGRYNDTTQRLLKEKGIVAVFADGESNYRFRRGIGRKVL